MPKSLSKLVALICSAAKNWFVLALVLQSVAISASKMRSAVNYATSAIAARASEPLTLSSELRLRLDEGNQIIDILPIAATLTCSINEAQAAGLDNVLDTRIFLTAAAPTDLARVSRKKSIPFAQEGQIDVEKILALIGERAVATRPT